MSALSRGFQSMATAPKINFFDGSGTTTNLVVTTNSSSFFLTGSVDANTIDVQIDFNGSGFSSDPTMVGLILPNFTVPNQNSIPEGLQLDRGVNVIKLRAVDISGSVSPETTITVTVVNDVELGTVLAPPTGVQIMRNATSVDVSWSDEFVKNAVGFNVYASTGPGGSGSGYLRVNSEIIPEASFGTSSEVESGIQEISYDFSESDISNKNLSVSITTVDSVTDVEIEKKTRNVFPLLTSPGYRVKLIYSRVDTVKRHSFTHNRNADLASGVLNNDTFSTLSNDSPLYYVVTAVYYSTATGVLQESRYSVEMAGAPLPLDSSVRGIRIRDQSAVAQDFIKVIQAAEPTLSLIPGSTVREVHVEPFSNEIQKAYFLMDFVHRAKSFSALLAIDDPSLTGVSVPVANSQYKQNLRTALATSSDAAVQSLIDSAFDSLAKNFGTPRKGRQYSTVVQTFYTTKKPTKDLYVAQNTIVSSSKDRNVPRFISKGQSVLPFADSQKFYNPDTKRWELRVQMIAETPGAAGNVPAGNLDTISSGASGFSTTNEVSGEGGFDVQSNLDLATEASRSLVSLDTGTAGGYEKITSSIPGVLDFNVVRSGDPFMMRDFDPIRMKHIGGKVDIYVKGTIERTVQETFAFQFSVAKNIRFDVIDPLNLVFRARDSRLTSSNPIQEVLFNPSQDLGLRNHSNLPVTSYDLTGVTIIDYRTIKLNTLIPQPPTVLDDFVEGDYRFRSNNKFVAGIQPIRSVSSITGQSSGPLDPVEGFTVFKLQDPLVEGESTIASDYVEINQVGNVPSGTPIQVNSELHVLIGQIEEPLESVGINVFTLSVYSQDRSVKYNGPNDLSPDYLIVSGSQTSPLKIVRTTYSQIPNGSTVSVDYEHDENFVVTYVVNDVLQRVQNSVSAHKHLTADAIVKQAIENPLAVETTVQLLKNFDQPTVDDAIRTSYSVMVESKRVGSSIHQSDVAAKIDDTEGVDYLVQPFARMTLQDGAMRVRDPVASESIFIPSLSAGVAAVYVLTEELPFATIDGGAASNTHHGVFKDGLAMEMASSLEQVGQGINRAWIVGNAGAVIAGYSDDSTLTPLFITPEAVASERLKRTANRVFVSLDFGQTPPDVPDDHSFSATYIVHGDTGTKDISTSQIEYIVPGSLTLTFRKAVLWP